MTDSLNQFNQNWNANLSVLPLRRCTPNLGQRVETTGPPGCASEQLNLPGTIKSDCHWLLKSLSLKWHISPLSKATGGLMWPLHWLQVFFQWSQCCCCHCHTDPHPHTVSTQTATLVVQLRLTSQCIVCYWELLLLLSLDAHNHVDDCSSTVVGDVRKTKTKSP